MNSKPQPDSVIPQTGYFAALLAVEQETARLSVYSALFKQRTGGSGVRWVTTSGYPLLYAFDFLLASPEYYQRH